MASEVSWEFITGKEIHIILQFLLLLLVAGVAFGLPIDDESQIGEENVEDERINEDITNYDQTSAVLNGAGERTNYGEEK